MLNFNDLAIASYGVGQDRKSSYEIQDSGATLALSGNGWKQVDFVYDITANTILEFDLKITSLGEIHAIGFDRDSSHSSNQIIQLGGTQKWGLGGFRDNPPVLGQWKTYKITVGEYFTGPMRYLTLINDHDVSNPTAASLFRNVRVYEPELVTAPLPEPENATINFATATITSYASQDRSAQVISQDDGATVQLSGNGWKKLALDYEVTEDTVIQFDFKSDRRGEIHAIGFDSDDRASSNQAFQLYGTQTWGRQDFRDYATSGVVGDWQSYEIPVGEFFTGSMEYLTLINDHDHSPRDAQSFFRNVQVFERGANAEAPFELGNLAGVSSRSESLSAINQSDRYRFTLDQTRDVSVILEGLSSDANLSLFNSDGQLILSSARGENQAEQIGQTLQEGTYELEVTSASLNASTDYDLIFSAVEDVAGQTRNLEVSTATYLGGTEHDEASAVEISIRNELVVAGNFGTAQGLGQAFLGADSSSAGQIVRMSLSGREVLSVTHLGDDINDMDLNRQTGTIAAVGDFGITVLNATGDQVLWSDDLNGATAERVAIANDGTVVSLHNKIVSVWNPDGSLKVQTPPLNRSYVEDVAIDPTSGEIYVTGFDNKYNNVDGNPVQVAFINRLDVNNNLSSLWQTWGYDADILTDAVNGKAQNDMADTRGYRITVGRDGELYFLGEVAGGNSVFRWNGLDRSTETQVKYDAYNDPYNSASPHQAYYARIDRATGEVMQGQLAFPRFNAAANAFRVQHGSISADEQGNVYVSGASFSGLDDRDNNAIAGQSVGGYAFRKEGDLTALVVSSDFQQRRLWTPFTAQADQSQIGQGKGRVQGFAVGQGRAALLGTVVEGTTITTADSALNPTAFNPGTDQLSDIYLATWATDTATGFASVQYGDAGVDNLVGGATADLLVGGLGPDTLNGDDLSRNDKRVGGADVFAYGSPAEGGDSILDFAANDRIRVSAAGFGLVAGATALVVSDSASLGSNAGFVSSNGSLSFDADGAGGQAATVLATLTNGAAVTVGQIEIGQ